MDVRLRIGTQSLGPRGMDKMVSAYSGRLLLTGLIHIQIQTGKGETIIVRPHLDPMILAQGLRDTRV